MELNGYGSHRLHQVEIEWTPEWEDAYRKLRELADKRRAQAQTVAHAINNRIAFLFVIVGPVALFFFWLDLDWLAGTTVAAMVLMIFYLLYQYDSSQKYENPTSSELDGLFAELHLLRSFTHDTGEMVACTQHEKRMFNPAPEPDEDDPISVIRDRLDDIGLSIEGERYAWLKPSDRSVLSRLNNHRKYGRIRLEEFRKIGDSGSH